MRLHYRDQRRALGFRPELLIHRLAQLTGGAWHCLDQLAVLRAVRALDGLSLATQRLHIACLRGCIVPPMPGRALGAQEP